jgi:hypothetical protein
MSSSASVRTVPRKRSRLSASIDARTTHRPWRVGSFLLAAMTKWGTLRNPMKTSLRWTLRARVFAYQGLAVYSFPASLYGPA